MRDTVCVASARDGVPADWTRYASCEFTLSLAAYERDLGYAGRRGVRRQLAVDVPRSVVLLDGARAASGEVVWRATAHPALCTQAVVAPAIEWLQRCGVHVHELRGHNPLIVDVRAGCTRVWKRLGYRRDALAPPEETPAVVHFFALADHAANTIVVSLSPAASHTLPLPSGAVSGGGAVRK